METDLNTGETQGAQADTARGRELAQRGSAAVTAGPAAGAAAGHSQDRPPGPQSALSRGPLSVPVIKQMQPQSEMRGKLQLALPSCKGACAGPRRGLRPAFL